MAPPPVSIPLTGGGSVVVVVGPGGGVVVVVVVAAGGSVVVVVVVVVVVGSSGGGAHSMTTTTPPDEAPSAPSSRRISTVAPRVKVPWAGVFWNAVRSKSAATTESPLLVTIMLLPGCSDRLLPPSTFTVQTQPGSPKSLPGLVASWWILPGAPNVFVSIGTAGWLSETPNEYLHQDR